MGYDRHNAILVTTYRKDYIERAHEEAQRLFDLATCGPVVSEICGEVTNGYYSFAVFPDGSKEGWPDSIHCDGKRELFKVWLHQQEYEDGSSLYDWVEVQYGDDRLETKIINDGDETRRNRYASEDRNRGEGTTVINLRAFTTAELLHLYGECEKISVMVRIGIKATEDDRLNVINVHTLTSQLTILQNQILHILNTRDEEHP